VYHFWGSKDDKQGDDHSLVGNNFWITPRVHMDGQDRSDFFQPLQSFGT
jgi:hypothetical protein